MKKLLLIIILIFTAVGCAKSEAAVERSLELPDYIRDYIAENRLTELTRIARPEATYLLSKTQNEIELAVLRLDENRAELKSSLTTKSGYSVDNPIAIIGTATVPTEAQQMRPVLGVAIMDDELASQTQRLQITFADGKTQIGAIENAGLIVVLDSVADSESTSDASQVVKIDFLSEADEIIYSYTQN